MATTLPQRIRMGIPMINNNLSGEIHVLHWHHDTYLGALGSEHVAVPRDNKPSEVSGTSVTYVRGNQCKHRENIQTPQKKGLSWPREREPLCQCLTSDC